MQINRQEISELLYELSTNKAVEAEILRNGGTEKVIDRVLSVLESNQAPKRKIDTQRSGIVGNDTVEKHQKRMFRLFCGIGNSFDQSKIDVNKLAFQIRFHDIDEMVDGTLGDIPTPAKEKLSPKGKATLKKVSQRILLLMAPNSAKRFGYNGDSVNALSEVTEKTTLESRTLKWFDLIDAYMCTIGEISTKGEKNTVLRKRQQEYIQRMIKFAERNNDVFSISTSDFFDINLWNSHFTKPEQNFPLYEKWKTLLPKN